MPAVEVMINTSTTQEYIREPEKTHMILDAVAEGNVTYQMQTFDQSLMALFKQNKITLEEAMRASSNPHEFSLRVKGIQGASDGRWDTFEKAGDAKPQASDATPMQGDYLEL